MAGSSNFVISTRKGTNDQQLPMDNIAIHQ